MIYQLKHITHYHYASPVALGDHVLRLTPVTAPGQQVLEATLDIQPSPTERHQWLDFFGNPTTAIVLDQPHDSLTLIARARIAVQALEPVLHTASWQEVRLAALAFADLGPRAPAHGLSASPAIALEGEITAYAGQSFGPHRPLLEAVLELTQRIKVDFVYDPTATEVTTAPLEAFQNKRGVCQDFAQVMIAGLRGLGLPALYVSGYLRTLPPPGQPRLAGADATHAWVAVWLGENIGWRGFDPTNGVMVGIDHVILAVGRDYCDVAPSAGIIRLGGSHTLSVAVDMVALSDA